MHDAAMGFFEPVEEIVLAELVHQEADGALVHAVDRLCSPHRAVQALQHQPVAAERDDDVGLRWIDGIIAPLEGFQRFLRLRRRTRDERNPVVAASHAPDLPGASEADARRTR